MYDLTDYRHPGGSGLMLRIAGRDGTSDYNAKHSSSLLGRIGGYIVGPLEGWEGGAGDGNPPADEFPSEEDEEEEDGEDIEEEGSDKVRWD